MVDMTAQNLITEVEKAIFQVAGAAVQGYSEDLILSKIQDAFLFMAEDPDVNWKRFQNRTFVTRTLDGTTGRTTVSVASSVGNFNDITAVYPDGTNTELVSGVVDQNPVLLEGNSPLQFIADDVDIMRVLPITATGNIVIVYRKYPAFPFIKTTVVPFDYLAIKYYVAWDYMVDDGTNPGAAEKLRQQFETRYKHLMKMQDRAGPAYNGKGGADYPTQWWG